MEANDFLAKIKANGDEKDWKNLAKVYDHYKVISSKLSSKERGSFSLNVLCLLCRNLEKAPSWRISIDNKDLLTLTIDCIRETRGLNKAEQVKTLACIYHIHKYVVRLNKQVPPELILKLSFMAFEAEPKNLLKEYSKTYWNILADRLCYIEKLQGKAIHKLLPKLTEDVLKTIEIYDTAQFCINVLVFLVKKLHFIYSMAHSEALNSLYKDIFEKLSQKTDLSAMKKLKDDELIDVYTKFCDCFYAVADNSSKIRFKHCPLKSAVRTALTLLGHKPDIFHCLQTFYLNSFCDIFLNKTTYLDAVFKNLTLSCDITVKLGYKTTMVKSYPLIAQLLRLFVEYSLNNGIKNNFSAEVQEQCLNFMLKLIRALKNCEQLLKYENCSVKTGLHDALRSSFSIKLFIQASLQQNVDLTNLLPLYNNIIDEQYTIMLELKQKKCSNYDKFYRKLQTDTHNTAIAMNKNQKYEFSIRLFEMYIKNELSINKNEFEHKNVARAFYNKSICELDFKRHKQALLDAFLSLIFSKELNSDKYMSLVMDIKAKALKIDDDDDENDDDKSSDDLQMTSVVDACKIVMENNLYGDLKSFFKEVKFRSLLKHEFDMYCKLWPSIAPVAGVWRALNSLLNGRPEEWITVENSDAVFWTLLEVVSYTPTAVRTIITDQFKMGVAELLDKIEKMPEPISSDIRLAHTILLCLQAEFDIADAVIKYNWKVTDTNVDADKQPALHTLPQEHTTLRRALLVVELWTELLAVVNTVTNKNLLVPALQQAEIFVQWLLYFSRPAHALQLAHICCQLAKYLDDKVSYIRNAGILLSTVQQWAALQGILAQATEYFAEIMENVQNTECGVVFLCDVAMYYLNSGSKSVAAKLIQLAQIRILSTYDKNPDVYLDLAVGRLLEVQTLLVRESTPTTLNGVTGIQRHYMSNSNPAPTSSKWSSRHLHSVTVKHRSAAACARTVRVSRCLQLWRRARQTSAVAAPYCAAVVQADMNARTVIVHKMDEAQVKIDNRLKYILGLPPSSDAPILPTEAKIQMFAPKQDFETMLECQTIKCQISPTRKYVHIPGFVLPEFFRHKNCDCYACTNPYCALIFYKIAGLEAATYFRGDEQEIAKNYFKGVINSFSYFDSKLKAVLNAYTELDFEKYIVDHVKTMFENEFRSVKLEILIEASFFEIKNGNFDAADDHIVTIHEICQEFQLVDDYLSNEIMNLMVASARLRNVVKKQEFDLEIEFENLKLSPKIRNEGVKTPESKAKLPQISARKVKDEELPKKRKVIKLNLDENSSDEKEEKPKPRKPVSEFKIPVPVTSKPVLEILTPRPSRKPVITVTDTTKTPVSEKNDKTNEFFTPMSTPEQFFTPLNTIKTYSKSSLRKGIVKNLEHEFSTPKAVSQKENAKNLDATRSSKKDEKDRALKRATSPGKLTENKTRPRRLRQPKLNE